MRPSTVLRWPDLAYYRQRLVDHDGTTAYPAHRGHYDDDQAGRHQRPRGAGIA